MVHSNRISADTRIETYILKAAPSGFKAERASIVAASSDSGLSFFYAMSGEDVSSSNRRLDGHLVTIGVLPEVRGLSGG